MKPIQKLPSRLCQHFVPKNSKVLTCGWLTVTEQNNYRPRHFSTTLTKTATTSTTTNSVSDSSNFREKVGEDQKNKDITSLPFYDVVIAGGGLIGTTLAVALGRSGRFANKKILLLESMKDTFMTGPHSGEKINAPDFSNRVVAISPNSRKVLEKLGIWNAIWRFQEVYSLQVWDALSNASISFNNPNFSSPVSYIVENPVLAYAISTVLKDTPNVTVELGCKLKSCDLPTQTKPSEQAVLSLNDNRKFRTNLLVGADGFNSLVRTAIQSPHINFNYDRIAIVATLKLTEKTENTVAWQRFLPTGGPIALLPLSPNYSSLVWSTTPERAQDLFDLPPDEFVDAINSAFWRDHPKSELVKISTNILSSLNLSKAPRMFPPSVGEVVDGSRASFPLGFGHAAHYISRRTALIGDAAHRVHPLAGQGLNLGMGDVATLHRVIDNAIGLGSDFGLIEVLKEYETERQRHNIVIQSGVDFLHRLYSFEFPPLVAIRSVGLSLVNSSDLLKKYIISQAAA